MAKKKLGVGAQYFPQFSRENLIYVDKTELLYQMMQQGVHNFIVRPRRFGKSLLLDTIAAMHSGQREQFKGTWAYDNFDFEAEKRPVLRIDFTLIDYGTQPLAKGLARYLQIVASELGLEVGDGEAKELFLKILQLLGKNKGVVVLIDEYEMAVTDFVGKDDNRLEENIFALKKFYGTMKGAAQYIHRSYITGVSKIGKIGILSDLNMLNDLSLDERFSTLFGYTEQELRHYYAEYITAAAEHHSMSEEEVLAHVKQHYNGYSWDGIEQNRVYNPFSIVNFFQNFDLRNYWFSTGTPTMLTRGLRRQKITLEELEHLRTSSSLLENANLSEFYGIGLLFQAGYLTIKSIERREMEKEYILGFPNREVRESFAAYLLAEYVNKNWEETEHTIAFKLRQHLDGEQLREAFQIFAVVIASTGYDITKSTEGYFHTIMHVLLYSTGLNTFSELQSAEGRLDIICSSHKATYIFEFKLDGTAVEALGQIKKKGYATPFLAQAKAVFLIGVNFASAHKKITEIMVEKWDSERFVGIEDDFLPYLMD
jgi:hypothetical protein